ncbi:Abi family protein [Corynebacterium renale]|uniref:Abortive infection bacteriophage resistance protein n=1 Tax=Corynebacterium renale TaxID=1724 RepID=A0A2A9DQ08_9CORY|nr:abortive infection bacteriophage resistance protein [Corynebacterium renale]SQI25663.1 Abi family protein [Corynebacterium renale]
MVGALKPALTRSQHIDLLRSRGMDVDDETACQWLSYVSYYRLSAYWYPAREFDANGRRSDIFLPGTRFRDVVELYEADRKLRTLVHDAMERIEVALRTQVGSILAEEDPLRYTDPSRFRSSFQHAAWMETAQKRIHRAGKNNEAIKHYRRKYKSRYPFWVLAEVLDFADISRLYEGLPSRDQHQIAKNLGISIKLDMLSKNQQRKTKAQSPLVRWMEQMTIVRNFCAHHVRLWNKSFMPVSTSALRTLPQFASLPEGQSERIFGVIVVMDRLLREISPGTTWSEKISTLIFEDFMTNPLVTPGSMGFPENWSML